MTMQSDCSLDTPWLDPRKKKKQVKNRSLSYYTTSIHTNVESLVVYSYADGAQCRQALDSRLVPRSLPLPRAHQTIPYHHHHHHGGKDPCSSQTTGSPPRDYPRSDRSILSVARIPFDSTLYTRAACAPSEHRSTPVHTDRRETPLASSFNPRTGVCPRLTARLSPFQRVLFLFVKYKLSTQTLLLTRARFSRMSHPQTIVVFLVRRRILCNLHYRKLLH